MKDFFDRLERVLKGGRMVAEALGEFRQELGDSPRKVPRLQHRDEIKGRLVTVRTIDDRIKIIRKLIRESRTDPEIIERARSIVNQPCGTPQAPKWCVPEKNPRAEVEAVHTYVKAHLRYVSDPVGHDTYASARAVFRMRGGDCDELHAAEAALLGALGYDCEIVAIQERGERAPNHVYLRTAYVENGELVVLPLDPSTDNPPGWEPPAEGLVWRRAYRI